MALDDPGAAFRFVGGRVCLDFINTVSGRVAHPVPGPRDYLDVVERERLVEFGDLTRWGRAARLLSAGESSALERAARKAPARATQAVTRARSFREALYRVFKAAVEKWTPTSTDLEVLNRVVSRGRSHERLASQAGGLGWVWVADGLALDRVLWPVARSAAELLTSTELADVSQCDGEDCHWLFLDTSRNRSRRWCDMAECGNRAKVRRFRGRR